MDHHPIDALRVGWGDGDEIKVQIRETVELRNNKLFFSSSLSFY